MIIFIFGDDIYQSQKRLNELKLKFREKYDDINVSVFSIDKKEEINLSQILSEIDSVPFLGAKRLIIIKELLKNSDFKIKEKVSHKLTHLLESSIIIFFEKSIPKKNDKLFKALLKLAKIEEFPKLQGARLLNFIKREVVSRGGKIEPNAATKLAVLVDDDSLRLSQEIDKLVNFTYPRIIKEEDVELLVSEKIKTKIFDLIDNLGARDGRLVIKSLHRLLALGEKDLYLLSMIVYGFRNLILVKYLHQINKNIHPKELAEILGLHPFVLQKTLSVSKLFSFKELKKIYHRLVKASLAMRETNNDPILTLDLLVSEICAR